jgi:ribosomal protein L37AE/L43A
VWRPTTVNGAWAANKRGVRTSRNENESVARSSIVKCSDPVCGMCGSPNLEDEGDGTFECRDCGALLLPEEIQHG